MRKILLFLILFIAIFFTFCNKESSTDTNPSSLLDVVVTLDSAQSKFIEFAIQTKGDPLAAMLLTESWLQEQPNVKNAYSIDGDYITIFLKSGLKTSFYFNEVDDKGYSRFRGGDKGISNKISKEASSETAFEILAKNKIENKKVLLFEADTKSLNLEPQIITTLNGLNSSGLDLEITVLRDKECTASVVETFKDYGLVFMDTHGEREAFQLGAKLDLSNIPKTEVDVKNAINIQLGSGVADQLTSGKLELAGNVKGNPQKSDWEKSIKPDDRYGSLMLPAKYISTLPPMPKTIIFGNFCYSGTTTNSFVVPEKKIVHADGSTTTKPAFSVTIENPVGKAFIDKNLISYYAFAHKQPPGTSRPVTDTLAKMAENVLVQRLAKNADSTGIANLMPDNKTEYFEKPDAKSRYTDNLYFRHFGADDYSYKKCGEPFQDARDGHTYNTVCMGGQTWMAENLNFDADESACYNNQPANCDVYGRLYNWETIMQGANASDTDPSGVQGVCPDGWHVPSKAEWDKLIVFAGGENVAGTALMSVTWSGGTNSSGFSALPAGWYIQAPNTFGQLGSIALFAMSSKDLVGNNIAVGLYGTPKVLFPVTQGTSCRCVKD